jgi:phenylpropionate dioxygenase-like ring-hydroxylating dioxygenase large terminal subunit
MPSPSFAEARSPDQKVRAAGLHPDYWYAVEYDDRVRRGQVVEVRFWGRSIALYRGADGRLRALENRCAHRQLPLSLGNVTGCALTCAYHGWSYGTTGDSRRSRTSCSANRCRPCGWRPIPYGSGTG